MFGSNQFAFIPRAVGGGKPELAYLKFSPEHEELAFQLGIQLAPNTTALSNGFVGPVAIIFRSDREIIFLNSVLSSPSTNTTSHVQTVNITVTPATTAANSTNTANITSRNTALETNRDKVVKMPFYAPQSIPNVTAQQVRADLIDSILFIH